MLLVPFHVPLCFVGVLEEAPDVLVNVNIIEAEKAAENIELRKKKTGYNPYEEEVEEVHTVSIQKNVRALMWFSTNFCFCEEMYN